MANLFDAINSPEGEPTELVVGHFIQWKRSDLSEDYPTLSGYTAEYVARITSGSFDEIKIPQSASSTNDYYLFTVGSSASSAFLPGIYRWQLEVVQTSSGNRIVVDSGSFSAIADMDNSQSDPRIHAEIMVAKIETILQGKADSDVASYSVAGRSLTKLSFQELLDAREYYKREVNNHKNKELLKRGKSGGATIKVRF